MTQPVTHDLTNRQLEAFKSRPSHALIAVGPTGIGKLTLALKLAEELLELKESGFAEHAYTAHIAPIEGKAIGIDQVRQIEKFLSLKVPSSKALSRALIIEDGHLMSQEAQNALLKSLEEPPLGTIIIITANQPQALLPTIRSRAQIVNVKAPAEAALREYFTAEGLSESEISRVYKISGGLPGLMNAMLRHQDHPLNEATDLARRLLGQSTYERLLGVDVLSKQKTLALDVLFILGQMARISLRTATGSASSRWRRVLETSYRTTESLQNSAQPKLALTKLMLDL